MLKNTNTLHKIVNFNFYKHKFIIITLFLAILLSSLLYSSKKGFNRGIDFAGGIVVESVCENCNVSQIIKQLEKRLNIKIQSQHISNGFLLKTTSTNNHTQILRTFDEVLTSNHAKIISKDFVSPQMTTSFIKDSIFACIFAFICIGVYIIIRFNIKFAISAMIALIYDVLTVACFISFTNIEVCLITLTAILTIIGYCINDKIIILDRIKANLLEQKKTVSNIILESTKSVIARSTITSITTCIVAISLLFFGDKSIYELGVIIIFGIIFGTISSLLLVPSLLMAFNVQHIRQKAQIKDPMWYAS